MHRLSLYPVWFPPVQKITASPSPLQPIGRHGQPFGACAKSSERRIYSIFLFSVTVGHPVHNIVQKPRKPRQHWLAAWCPLNRQRPRFQGMQFAVLPVKTCISDPSEWPGCFSMYSAIGWRLPTNFVRHPVDNNVHNLKYPHRPWLCGRCPEIRQHAAQAVGQRHGLLVPRLYFLQLPGATVGAYP